MAAEELREVGHDAPINHILSTFKQAGVDLETFEAKALNAGSEHIYNEIKQALESVQSYFHTNANPRKDKEGNTIPGMTVSQMVKFSLELLKSIAAFSPEFKKRMGYANLLDMDYKQFLNNQNAMLELRNFMLEALRMDVLRQVHIDLENALREYYITADNAAKAQAKKLRENLGQHDKTANAEFIDLGATSTANKRSNSMFDPVKVIGHLLNSIYYLHVLAPLKNKLFPNAKFTHKTLDPSQDPQRLLNNQKYGGTLAPGAAAPAESAPKPAGPQ